MIGKKERVVSLCDNCWVNERDREEKKERSRKRRERKEKYEMSVKKKEEMKEWQKRGEECLG